MPPSLLDLITNDEARRVNQWHADLRLLIGRAHDVGLENPEELQHLFNNAVALMDEWLGASRKRERAREDRLGSRDFDAIPAIGGGV